MNAMSPFGTSTANAAVIRSPADMAQLLHSGCPDQAHGYALAAHEKACQGHDEDRTVFWGEVTRLLSSGWVGMERAS